jgi:hypothetical protein
LNGAQEAHEMIESISIWIWAELSAFIDFSPL